MMLPGQCLSPLLIYNASNEKKLWFAKSEYQHFKVFFHALLCVYVCLGGRLCKSGGGKPKGVSSCEGGVWREGFGGCIWKQREAILWLVRVWALAVFGLSKWIIHDYVTNAQPVLHGGELKPHSARMRTQGLERPEPLAPHKVIWSLLLKSFPCPHFKTLAIK